MAWLISEKLGHRLAIPPDPKILPTLFRASAVPNCFYDGLDQFRYLALISGFPVLFGLFYFLSGKLPPPKRLAYLSALAVITELCLVVFTFMNWRRQDEAAAYFARFWIGICLLGLGGVLLIALRTKLGKAAWCVTSGILCKRSIFWIIAVGYCLWRLLPSFYTAANLALADLFVWFHFGFTLNEFAAPLNGRFPLVDYFPQYSTLLPYLALPLFKVIGLNVTTFSLLMVFLSLLIFLSILSVLLRVTRRREAALLLFIPLLAAATYTIPDLKFFNPFNYYAVGPLRYFFPLMVAGLCSLNLKSTSNRRQFALFLLAGLGVVNNLDFGIPALGAAGLSTLIAYRKPRSALLAAVSGLISAFALFYTLSWLHTGLLPRFDKAVQFQKIFALYGFFMLPMPLWGQHVLEELTFFAALAVGIVRLFTLQTLTEDLRQRTGMLVFTATFGLGTLTYFVGRSHFQVLPATFLAWAFCLSLLIWECIVGLRELRGFRRALLIIPSACLAFMYAQIMTQVPLVANPLDELRRYSSTSKTYTERFSAEVSKIRAEVPEGSKTVVLTPFGHMLAQDAGVENLSPYSQNGSIMLLSQVELLLGVIDKNQIKTVFGEFDSEISDGLLKRHFKKTESLSVDFDVWKQSP